jgi:DNA-binding response OmpR family regulator
MSALQRENSNDRPTQDLAGTRILLAEDDEHIRDFLTFLLAENGAIVDSVETGVESMLNALSGRYHLVLMDLNLPIMNGETAVKKLRDSGYVRPILAMSAQDEQIRKSECIDQGFDDFLSKPFHLDELIQKLVYWKNADSGRDQRMIH